MKNASHDANIGLLKAFSQPPYLVVDVGCRGGDLPKALRWKLPAHYIGIDPSREAIGNHHDEFYSIAIDDVSQEETRTFYTYSVDEGCNSLLPMNKEVITHDRNEYDSKWYVKKPIEFMEDRMSVRANSLKNVLLNSESFKEVGYVHYLKVDAQGSDINVVKSLGELVNKTCIIQIESAIPSNEDVLLYKGQQHYKKDVEDMNSMGFVEWFKENYSIDKMASPEADVVFINEKFWEVVV